MQHFKKITNSWKRLSRKRREKYEKKGNSPTLKGKDNNTKRKTGQKRSCTIKEKLSERNTESAKNTLSKRHEQDPPQLNKSSVLQLTCLTIFIVLRSFKWKSNSYQFRRNLLIAFIEILWRNRKWTISKLLTVTYKL